MFSASSSRAVPAFYGFRIAHEQRHTDGFFVSQPSFDAQAVFDDVERSKFLRKPLNVQSGQDDGHQGGTRYEPDSPGYRIIREWVLKQTVLQK